MTDSDSDFDLRAGCLKNRLAGARLGVFRYNLFPKDRAPRVRSLSHAGWDELRVLKTTARKYKNCSLPQNLLNYALLVPSNFLSARHMQPRLASFSGNDHCVASFRQRNSFFNCFFPIQNFPIIF